MRRSDSRNSTAAGSGNKHTNISLFAPSDTEHVIELFTRVFSASEGHDEGKSIGNLVANLIATTDPADLIGWVAKSNDSIVGGIFFSRFRVPSGQVAFLLSPVAVETLHQRTGIGRRLIHCGLEHLRSQNVALVFTYGDPAFYAQTGFAPLSENVVQAPFPLSQPVGWLAQSLDGRPIRPMSGASRCVAAFNDPGYR